MRWTKAVKSNDGSLAVPDNWLFPHYYDALNALFRIENGLRTFVYVVLKNEYRAAWTDLNISVDDGGSSTIASVAKKRLARDQRFGYLGSSVNSPLAHLTSGELIGAVLADAYWPIFAQYFPMAKEVVRLKLDEISNVRNALAHFRPIKADDVEVVKQNANQVLIGVEGLLQQVVRTPQDVPTNTVADWYPVFDALASAGLSVDLYQSDDERWLRVQLTYLCQKVGMPHKSESYHWLRLLTVSAVSLLRALPELTDAVVLAYDYPMHLGGGVASRLEEFTIEMNFVFGFSCFQRCYVQLADAFRVAIGGIEHETKLIADDNLVRGRFVRIGDATINLDKRIGWIADTSALLPARRSDDPPEFWGSRPFWGDDLLTETSTYPWMQVDVAEEPLPF